MLKVPQKVDFALILLRRLAGDASVLWILQVLNAWEAHPTPLGGRKLVDLETTEEANLQLVEKTIANYSARLLALQQELTRACRRVHAIFAILIAERGLLDLCGNELERHRSLWSARDFRRWPGARIKTIDGDTLIAVLPKPGHKPLSLEREIGRAHV